MRWLSNTKAWQGEQAKWRTKRVDFDQLKSIEYKDTE